MATKKKVDQLLDELVKGKTPSELLGETGLLRQLTKRLAERALEAEMTAHLGYEKHAAEGRTKGNSRNGVSSKRVKSDQGEVEVDVPRDRDGTFEPQLIRKRQRRLAGFDDKVLALYACGLTTREIQGHLKELYGVSVSPTLISAVTDAVLDDVAAWQSRPVERFYPILYLDALHVKMRRERHVQNCAVYVALGVNMDGHKEVLGLWIGESEGAKFWLSVLTELRNRGLEDVLIAAVDGLKGFPEAIAAVFPQTSVQLCIVHMVRASARYVSWKHQKNLTRDLRRIYTAPDIHTAEKELANFEQTWNAIAPHISRLWRSNWANLTTFFDYPPPIRRAIYTTNAIESIQAQLRRVLRKRGAFPTSDAALKVLYLAIMKAQTRWTMPIREWQPALLHFSIVFPGRVPL